MGNGRSRLGLSHAQGVSTNVEGVKAQPVAETQPRATLRRLVPGLNRDVRLAYLFLLPTFVLVVGLIIYPFLRAFYLSLTDKLVGYPERFVGLQNYLYLAGDATFRQVVANSLLFTAGSVTLKVLTG